MTREQVFAALAEPFPPDEVSWKPQAVKGDSALAIAYVDARTVMDRLDSVLGLGNWQTTYRELPEGSVVCRLRIRFEGEWFEHEDVGSPSEQSDGGDRLKASFSDGLKRAAIHVGVGRYLYSLPHKWEKYDQQKRWFVKTPTLPDWAIPKPKKTEPAAKKPVSANAKDEALANLKMAATKGTEQLKQVWTSLPAEILDVLQPHIEELKEVAASVKQPTKASA